MSRIIETLDQLNALRDGAVLHSYTKGADFPTLVFVKEAADCWYTNGDERGIDSAQVAKHHLPMTLLFEPTPDPVAVEKPSEPPMAYYKNPKDGLVENGAIAVVYGESDDCIEFDGLLYDEVSASPSLRHPRHFILTNGVNFWAYYDKGGVWRFLIEDEDVEAGLITLDKHPLRGEAENGRYTDYLWIHTAGRDGKLGIFKGGQDDDE